MTLRTRLILTIGGVAVLLTLPALYAADKLGKLRDIATSTYSVHGAASLAMGRFQAHVVELRRLQATNIAFPDSGTVARRDSALVRAKTQLTYLTDSGYEVAERGHEQLDSLEAVNARTDAMIARGLNTEATEAADALRPLYPQWDAILDDVAAAIDSTGQVQLTDARRISETAYTQTILALVIGLFIALLLGTWATQTMVRPIYRLRRSMAAVAAGEFVVPEGLPYDRHDEIGDLSRSFRGMTQHLADLDRMKADFMSVATHELKTPINVISGYAELIQEGLYGPLTPRQHEALMAMQEQSRNLTQLINQLLDISRLEAGGLRLEINEIDVPEMLDRLRRTFDGMAHQQHVDLQMNVADDAPLSIPGDADRLRDQVFGNLLSNALKFTPEGGKIRVQAFGQNSSLVVEVSDTGPGIASDQLPHVFDKYYQIGEQARSKGAGLGLTIAHDVVEAHGGEVSVVSVEGHGTTFRIELPTQREKVEQARHTAAVSRQDR